MSIKRKRKYNSWELEKERISNFVIDLRPTTKKEKKDTKDNKENRYQRFRKTKILKLNLLKHRSHKFYISPKLKRNIFRKKKNKSWKNILEHKVHVFNNYSQIKFHKIKTNKLSTKKKWYQHVLLFAVVLILIIFSFKLLSYIHIFDISKIENNIIDHSRLAVANLMAASDSIGQLDFQTANNQFKDAGNGFLEAEDELNKFNDALLILAKVTNNKKAKLAVEGEKFLKAGAIASSLGVNLSQASDKLFNNPSGNFSDNLNSFIHYGQLAISDTQKLRKELNRIKVNNLPSEYQDQVLFLRTKADTLLLDLSNFINMSIEFRDALGLSEDKRYLLVFQNNSELRASGGFIGSYALVDIRNAEIRNMEIPAGGSYDVEGAMKVLVKAPKALRLVNPLWHFWDANWWPDWPTTAKNLMWFYEKSGGPTVDGVISITPTVVEKLLQVTGPIDLNKEYGLTINSDNFWETVQRVVEDKNLEKTKPEAVLDFNKHSKAIKTTLPIKQDLNVNTDNKPKKIIGDLTVKILEVLPSKLDKNNLIKLMSVFEESLEEKQILFYFTDKKLEAQISKNHWGGRVLDTKRDYLMVINTNIAGQKSDRAIEESINHDSKILSNGDIIDTVTIIRKHKALNRTPLVGVRNVDWLRVYVPQGSQLIKATGFKSPDKKYFSVADPSWQDSPLLINEMSALVHSDSGTKIYKEDNKTVFANWVMLDPEETVKVVLQYRLPFSFSYPKNNNYLEKMNKILNPNSPSIIPYSLLIQKQPGALASHLNLHLSLPNNYNVFWHYPKDLNCSSGWDINTLLNHDKYFSILVKNNNLY